MSGNPNKISNFWQELKRRKVVRVITVYAAAAFVILELVSIIVEPLKLPEWTLPMIIVLLCVGFIIAVILSWIYDIHPEGGIVKTESAHKVKAEDITKTSNSWKIASYISFVVIVALVILNIIPRAGKKEILDKSIAVLPILDKSIAVLPFESLSDDPEKQYLADGVMGDILLHLAKIKDLRVMSSTSVQQYRNTDKTATEICEELGVSYLLEGRFQKYGVQARLIVQLIQTGKEGHAWANDYNREWKDIFAVQSEVAQTVAGELQAMITPELKLRIESEPTENMQAYNLYLQGRHSYESADGKEGIDQSIQFYKQALDLDPDFALAYSALAASYSAYAYSGTLPRSEVMEPARDAALKALSVDNTLGEAHAELAWTQIYQDFNWEEGEKGIRHALQLNPNYASGRLKYSWLLTYVGRFDEAIDESKHALELDPLSVDLWVWLGCAYIYAGYDDLAIEELNRVLSNYPDSDYCRRMLSIAYMQKGMVQEAMDEFSKVSTKGMHWFDGYIYGMAGETEMVREVLDYHLDQSKIRFIKPTDFTVIYAALGEYDRALDYLEQAYYQREGWLVLMQVEPMYDNLRDEPRFQAILEKMNYPPVQ